MRLSPCRFNAFLNHIGQDVTWRVAHACPCVVPHSGAARPNCPVCSGKKWFWGETPVPSRIGVAGTRVQRDWRDFGRYESGDMVITLPSDQPIYAMGEFDRVVAVQSSDVFQLQFTRGRPGETLRFAPQSLTRAFWLDAAQNVVDGVPPVADATGALTWGAGGPPVGTQYTLRGTRSPEYYCFSELPADRPIHGDMRLPRKVVLRKWDLFGR